tara:strand:- start:100 stop:579 length:480 start_codon:yes stop_codon:yes gene_type:complete
MDNYKETFKYEKLEADDPRLTVNMPILGNLKINLNRDYIDRYLNPGYWYSPKSKRSSYPHSLSTMFWAVYELLESNEVVNLTLDEEDCSALFNVLFSAMLAKGLIPQSKQRLGGILDDLVKGPVVNDFSGDEATDSEVLSELIEQYLTAWGHKNYTDPD